jgi:hypothetical protein
MTNIITRVEMGNDTDNTKWIVIGVFIGALTLMPVIHSYLYFRQASDIYSILLHVDKYWIHIVLNLLTLAIGTAGSILLGYGIAIRNKKILIAVGISVLVYGVMWVLGYNRYLL